MAIKTWFIKSRMAHRICDITIRNTLGYEHILSWHIFGVCRGKMMWPVILQMRFLLILFISGSVRWGSTGINRRRKSLFSLSLSSIWNSRKSINQSIWNQSKYNYRISKGNGGQKDNCFLSWFQLEVQKYISFTLKPWKISQL